MKKGRRVQRSLLVVLTLAMFMMIATAFAILYHSERYSEVTNKLYKVQSLANEIVYYNEALTQSARMYAYENESESLLRYQAMLSKLDLVLNQASKEEDFVQELIKKMYFINSELISIEKKAFQAVQNGQNRQAQEMLKSTEYLALKQDYAQQISFTFDKIHIKLINLQKTHDEQYRTFLWILGIQVLAFVIIWFYLVSFLRRNVSRLSELITTDELTGLGNRRGFDDILRRELRRSTRDEKILMLAVIDIDHFKKYNDYYGHPMGDQVLSLFGKLLQKTLRRANEFGFRIGGEEFAIIASLDNVKDGIASIEYLMQKLEEKNIEHKGNDAIGRMTLSVGIAYHHAKDVMTDEQLYSAADKALYEAKATGRNKLVQYYNDKA